MQLRKIMCAVDFSPGSDDALKVAVRVAMEHASELVIAHAWYVPPIVFAGEVYPADLVQSLSEDAEHGLAAAVAKAQQFGAPKVSALALNGPPWERLVEAAEQASDIDLIVLGSRKRGAVTRAVFGSVADMVVRHAPCSVLAVPAGGAKAFYHALVPIDFSDSSRLALELAADLCRSANGALSLIHVIEPARGAYRGAALDLLDQWRSRITSTNRATTTQVRAGSVSDELRNLLVEPARYDLVAMGSHGRTGLRRLMLGSNAETAVRHAQCVVLVARPRT